MSGRAIRLSCVVATACSFLALWAAIAAHPWGAAAKRIAVDPRLAALADKQRRLRYEAKQVKSLLDRRWAAYGRRLSKREQEIALIESRHRTALAAARAARARIAAELAARAAAAQTASQQASLTSAVSPAGTVSTAPTHPVAPASATSATAPTPAAPAPTSAPPPVVTVVTTTPVTTTRSSSH